MSLVSREQMSGLETLIDQHGLNMVVRAIALVGFRKATNSTNADVAKWWGRCADELMKAADRIGDGSK